MCRFSFPNNFRFNISKWHQIGQLWSFFAAVKQGKNKYICIQGRGKKGFLIIIFTHSLKHVFICSGNTLQRQQWRMFPTLHQSPCTSTVSLYVWCWFLLGFWWKNLLPHHKGTDHWSCRQVHKFDVKSSQKTTYKRIWICQLS